jgi:epoxyqueuosine reductase
MIDNSQVKRLAVELGADLCGVAPVERFEKAPQGFHPRDLFPQTRSVVVVAKRMPEGPFYCTTSMIPYTIVMGVTLTEVLRISCLLGARIEREAGVVAMPMPGDPYDYWDEQQREGKGLLSLRHAGWLAGLGVLGKNTLLTNAQYGNRLSLGAVLLDIELEGDPMIDSSFCPATCHLCIDTCPVGALTGVKVTQKLCRSHSVGKTKKNEPIYTCNACRKTCPNGPGRRTVGEC